MRPYVALYVGGMGSRKQNFYNALVQRYGFEDAAREVQDLYLEGKKDEAAAALPGRADRHGRRCAGRATRVRERLAVYRDAGVGTLMVAPMAWTFEERLRRSCGSWPSWPLEGLPRRLRRPGPRVPDARARGARWSRAATRSRCRRGSAGASTSRRPA